MIMIGGDTESTPPYRAGDNQLSRSVHGCHHKLFPSLKRRLAPLMGVAGMARRCARDRKGKGKGKVGGVAVCSETDTSARENRDGRQGKIRARSPRSPYSKGRVTRDDIAGAARTRTVATVSAVSTDEPIQARCNCFDGIHRTDKDPDLDHVSGFAVVGRGLEARRNNHTVAIFVENETVHRAPPFVTVNRTLRPVVSFGPDA